MGTIDAQILSASNAIERNIELLSDRRDLLSQNVLAQLRNLVEGLIVREHVGDGDAQFSYDDVRPSLRTVGGDARTKVLARFHNMLQSSVSHYTVDGDPSERLMLKYYEFLMRSRDLAQTRFGLTILSNLARFPIDIDPALKVYYEQIVLRIEKMRRSTAAPQTGEVYYVHSSKPFFVAGRIFYEVTYSIAHNRASKFDRRIAFTDIDLTDKYAAELELVSTSIDVIGKPMPVTLIRSWKVAIRGCEFRALAKFFSWQTERVSRKLVEYRNLMAYLTDTKSSLLDLMDMEDGDYLQVRAAMQEGAKRSPLIFATLDQAREKVRAKVPGHTLLRYLMLRMNNQVLKNQHDGSRNSWLSNMYLSHSSRPFDTMPFCSSPRKHKAHYGDLVEALNSATRRHEILAKRIMTNVENRGMIYTPEAELDGFGDLDELIATYNRLLPPTSRHAPRKLVRSHGHVFMAGYEDDTVDIIEELQRIAQNGLAGHQARVLEWLDEYPGLITDELKADALQKLFVHSKVALIYGAAGTGKTTMVEHIADYFADKRKLFLAHTNPAVENLRRRVEAPGSEFSTITGHVNGRTDGGHYDVLVIDECSTVSNASLLEVLRGTSFDLLVLVGDVYQIEAIEFGNWFGSVRSYLPTTSVFELTKPYRTSDERLLTIWNRVRSMDDRIEEALGDNTAVLGDALFESTHDDEIVLCVNYDGLYGINNVNRFMQASNPNPPFERRGATFKVGDPILFNDTFRFGDVIFNNLKGQIQRIEQEPGRITFDVELDRDVSEGDVWGTDLTWVEGSTVRFDVHDMADSDEDDDDASTVIPFQIAYAVSFHKAQGLEFDSVKVVITAGNEERVTHSMFYTAITRARQQLRVFWTPETQKRVLSSLRIAQNDDDEILLRARRNMIPVSPRVRRRLVRDAP